MWELIKELRKAPYIIIFVMLLGAYAPIELTRVWILNSWRYYGGWYYIAETVLMWICYLSIIPLLVWRLRK